MFPLTLNVKVSSSPKYKTNFSSINEYIDYFSSLINYHINKKLYEISQKYLII